MRIVPSADKTTLPVALITPNEAKTILRASPGFRFGSLTADLFLQRHFVEQGFEVHLSDDSGRVDLTSMRRLSA